RPPAAATRRAHGSCGRSRRCSSSTIHTGIAFVVPPCARLTIPMRATVCTFITGCEHRQISWPRTVAWFTMGRKVIRRRHVRKTLALLAVLALATTAFAGFKPKLIKAKKAEQFEPRAATAGATYAADLLLEAKDQ